MQMWKSLVVIAALLAASAAFAQDAAAVFAALDADHNGSISPMEAQRNQVVAANFTMADTNNDGMLSREEFIAAFGAN
jgi:Ca2+-binding EF-hand superfamily protein